MWRPTTRLGQGRTGCCQTTFILRTGYFWRNRVDTGAYKGEMWGHEKEFDEIVLTNCYVTTINTFYALHCTKWRCDMDFICKLNSTRSNVIINCILIMHNNIDYEKCKYLIIYFHEKKCQPPTSYTSCNIVLGNPDILICLHGVVFYTKLDRFKLNSSTLAGFCVSVPYTQGRMLYVNLCSQVWLI